mmetsp:Transcript_5811/g.16817  ORF Transcript_5811/g.16817 Transcript_5811/m.16817 type:complete len:266 (-) Transcript_5811:66-863(-)
MKMSKTQKLAVMISMISNVFTASGTLKPPKSKGMYSMSKPMTRRLMRSQALRLLDPGCNTNLLNKPDSSMSLPPLFTFESPFNWPTLFRSSGKDMKPGSVSSPFGCHSGHCAGSAPTVAWLRKSLAVGVASLRHLAADPSKVHLEQLCLPDITSEVSLGVEWPSMLGLGDPSEDDPLDCISSYRMHNVGAIKLACVTSCKSPPEGTSFNGNGNFNLTGGTLVLRLELARSRSFSADMSAKTLSNLCCSAAMASTRLLSRSVSIAA